MTCFTHAADFSLASSSSAVEHPHQAEDHAYQAMTIAAILLVLASLWVF